MTHKSDNANFLGHNLPGNWRGCPFCVGQKYRVIAAATSYGGGSLTIGEVLEYAGASYGIYFEESVYVFTANDGTERTWLLPDSEGLENWDKFFEPA